MSWGVVPDNEIGNVLAATREGRCVSCYGDINRDCAADHELYCCACDDTDCQRNGSDMSVRVSEPIDGNRWVYSGEGEHAMAVRVTQAGCIIPSLTVFWPSDIPHLVACLEAAADLVSNPT